MYNPVDVCWFDSAMQGAYQIPTNTPGSVITVLDQCLLSGFNSQTLTSLVVSGGVATATKTSHGFWNHTVVLIAGATPTDLNGKKRITLVNSSTFTFEAVGIADGTATGTITAKMAPVGWTKTGDSTNAYYTKPGPGATPWAFLVDDAYNGYAIVAGRHTNGSTIGGTTYSTYIYKGSQTSRKWSVYADGRAVFFAIDYSGTDAQWRITCLADLISFADNDPNACLLLGSYNTSGSNSIIQCDGTSASGVGSTLMTGTVGYRFTIRLESQVYSGYGTGLLDGSAAGDGCFQCTPMEIWGARNPSSDPRGILPAMYCSLHDWDCVSHGTVLSNPQWVRSPQLRDHKIRVVRAASNGMVVMDITGPWYPTDKYYGAYRIRGTAKKQGAVGRFPLALMVKNSGQIIRKTMSASDGSFVFNNIDYLLEGYTVVEYDGEIADPLNAAIADLVTPEAMP
jgi:hypothetical protein